MIKYYIDLYLSERQRDSLELPEPPLDPPLLLGATIMNMTMLFEICAITTNEMCYKGTTTCQV